MKYCIVGTDKKLAKQISEYFGNKKLKCTIVEDYDSILTTIGHFSLYEYDLYILMISDDDKRGLDLIEYFHTIGLQVPAIFLGKGDKINLMSLVLGRSAIDYIHEPIDLKELELRIAKCKRKQIDKDEIDITNEHAYTFSERAVSSEGYYLDLTEKQSKILYLLMTHKNSVVTYSMIQDYVYDGEEFSSNAIATHMRDIRKKIKDIPIKSIKGQGYILKI